MALANTSVFVKTNVQCESPANICAARKKVQTSVSLMFCTRPPLIAATLQFFLDARAFAAEINVYSNSELRKVMPAIHAAIENIDGALRGPGGYVFPPAVVIERGESLDEFAARVDHQPITVIQALVLVVKCVQVRHGATVPHVHAELGEAHCVSVVATP
jgi:hypothetical protein